MFSNYTSDDMALNIAQQSGVIESFGGWLQDRFTPSSIPDMCPGQPATSLVEAAWRNAPVNVKNRLAELYANANNGASMPGDMEHVARAAMGGADCKTLADLNSTGNQLKTYFLGTFMGYANISSSGAVPTQIFTDAEGNEWGYDPLREMWEILKRRAQDLPQEILADAVTRGGEVLSDASQPVIQERATSQLIRALPMIALGVAVAFMLRGAGR